jgi:hypothetical protein
MTSGKVIWKFDGISGLIQGQPALSEKNVVFGAWDRHLYCLDKKTGELVWKWNNGKPHQLYSPGNIAPVIANGKVFIVAPDRCMTAIDLVSGKQIWRDCSHQVRESMGISPDKKQVYAKLMNDSVISVSTVGDQFHLNWVIDAGFGYEHIPCPLPCRLAVRHFADVEPILEMLDDGGPDDARVIGDQHPRLGCCAPTGTLLWFVRQGDLLGRSRRSAAAKRRCTLTELFGVSRGVL